MSEHEASQVSKRNRPQAHGNPRPLGPLRPPAPSNGRAPLRSAEAPDLQPSSGVTRPASQPIHSCACRRPQLPGFPRLITRPKPACWHQEGLCGRRCKETTKSGGLKVDVRGWPRWDDPYASTFVRRKAEFEGNFGEGTVFQACVPHRPFSATFRSPATIARFAIVAVDELCPASQNFRLAP